MEEGRMMRMDRIICGMTLYASKGHAADSPTTTTTPSNQECFLNFFETLDTKDNKL